MFLKASFLQVTGSRCWNPRGSPPPTISPLTFSNLVGSLTKISTGNVLKLHVAFITTVCLRKIGLILRLYYASF